MEMSYLKGTCGVTRWEGESNESVYERCSMSACANGVNCGVGKDNTLQWFGHVEKIVSGEFVKMYDRVLKSPNRRGRPPGRWKDKVKESLGERGTVNPA